MNKINNVILCGGAGSRLWPLSRPGYPKQFLKIFDGKSLLQLTVERNNSISDCHTIVVSSDLLHHAINQIEELELNGKEVRYLCEPCPKNTYPAILLAAFNSNKDDFLFVTPSDHVIRPLTEYEKAVHESISLAENNKIVTFGIQPTSPHPGYGYIEASGNNILSFKEKPSIEVAEGYLAAGNFYWNGGMFCMKAEAILSETQRINPSFFSDISDVYSSREVKNRVVNFSLKEMKKVDSISIDYGCMEKTNLGAVVSCRFEWNDLGNYQSLTNHLKDSLNQNIIYNTSKNSYFFTDKKIVSFGLQNVIAYEDSEFLFLGNLEKSEEVKTVYEDIKKYNEKDVNGSLSDHRPWGSYDSPVDEESYKVKVITVLPGKSLSLQRHQHRSEHWIVVQGIATVTVGESTKKYKENEHIFIPKKETHRLENETQCEIKIIEVQFGNYLGEDDIERLEDKYGRV